MKSLSAITFLALAVVALADVLPSQYSPLYRQYLSPEAAAPILRQLQSSNPDGSYAYEFETGNAIRKAETGVQENGENVVRGSYSYVGDDGLTYTVNYIADRNGYRAYGDHLPQQPDVSANIDPISQARESLVPKNPFGPNGGAIAPVIAAGLASVPTIDGSVAPIAAADSNDASVAIGSGSANAINAANAANAAARAAYAASAAAAAKDLAIANYATSPFAAFASNPSPFGFASNQSPFYYRSPFAYTGPSPYSAYSPYSQYSPYVFSGTPSPYLASPHPALYTVPHTPRYVPIPTANHFVAPSTVLVAPGSTSGHHVHALEPAFRDYPFVSSTVAPFVHPGVAFASTTPIPFFKK